MPMTYRLDVRRSVDINFAAINGIPIFNNLLAKGLIAGFYGSGNMGDPTRDSC